MNKKHTYLITLILVPLSLFLTSCGQQEPVVDELPNILWITCEDIHPILGSYGDEQATTPVLDELAVRGTRFTHAFATAPVCAPARSCIITGVQATSLGTQNLRSEVAIPDFITPFPKLMRRAGYYCTNNDKEDYSFTDTSIWDESSKSAHWRNRPDPDQPFFAVFNLEMTHQSGIFGTEDDFEKRFGTRIREEERHDPENIELFPYFPDTPELRAFLTRYYDNVTVMDRRVGEILAELEADGHADDTIVFFYADHGIGLARGKRTLYDTGIQVPFLVYAPDRFRASLGLAVGGVSDAMVSFEDLAPTALQLANVAIPEYMDGQPVFDPNRKRDVVIGTSDRVDEAFEFSRSVRSHDWLYVRNYYPHLPLLQPNYYSDKSAVMKELRRAAKEMELTAVQQALWAPQRAPEELYYTPEDPFQLHNLAADPEYQQQLGTMRDRLRVWQMESRDTGFVPEAMLRRLEQGSTAYQWMRSPDGPDISAILDVLSWQMRDSPDAATVRQTLASEDPLIRYWALVSLSSHPPMQQKLKATLVQLLEDPEPLIRLEAAKALVESGEWSAIDTVIAHLQSDNDLVLLYAARTFELLGERVPGYFETLRPLAEALIERVEGQWQGYDLYASWALRAAFLQQGIDL